MENKEMCTHALRDCNTCNWCRCLHREDYAMCEYCGGVFPDNTDIFVYLEERDEYMCANCYESLETERINEEMKKLHEFDDLEFIGVDETMKILTREEN